jgi:hypothetical protein
MEAVRSSEKLVTTYNAIRRHNPEDYNPNYHRRENLQLFKHVFIICVAVEAVGQQGWNLNNQCARQRLPVHS